MASIARTPIYDCYQKMTSDDGSTIIPRIKVAPTVSLLSCPAEGQAPLSTYAPHTLTNQTHTYTYIIHYKTVYIRFL